MAIPEAESLVGQQRGGLQPAGATVSTPIQVGPSGAVEIHYATVFDGRTPTLCGVTTTPKPGTNEWRYVSCRACLVLGARSSRDAMVRLHAIEAADRAHE